MPGSWAQTPIEAMPYVAALMRLPEADVCSSARLLRQRAIGARHRRLEDGVLAAVCPTAPPPLTALAAAQAEVIAAVAIVRLLLV